MMKMKFTNERLAFDYTIYMIVGSYFKKAKCQNQFMETRLRINYLEEKVNSQYRMEEVCINYTEKKLRKELPGDIWDEEMKVYFVCDKDNMTYVAFVGEKYILCLKGKYRGKGKKNSYRLFVKKQTK